MDKKLHEVDVNVSECMEETLAYFDKQLKAQGFTQAPRSWQNDLFNCCRDADDVLAALAYLIEQGVPVPLIIADIRLYDQETIRLAMRAHTAHHRERAIEVERANKSKLVPVFRAPALAAAL